MQEGRKASNIISRASTCKTTPPPSFHTKNQHIYTVAAHTTPSISTTLVEHMQYHYQNGRRHHRYIPTYLPNTNHSPSSPPLPHYTQSTPQTTLRNPRYDTRRTSFLSKTRTITWIGAFLLPPPLCPYLRVPR